MTVSLLTRAVGKIGANEIGAKIENRYFSKTRHKNVRSKIWGQKAENQKAEILLGGKLKSGKIKWQSS